MQPSSENTASLTLWKGFHHEWLRNVLGFRVPHRISKLDSVVSDEQFSGGGQNWRGMAKVTMGQSTGVDGNFMRPRLRLGALSAAGIAVRRDSVTLHWADDSDDGDYPKAATDLEQTLVHDVNDPRLAFGELDHYTAVLQGIQLSTSCPTNESCNSNGMWPHKFFVSLGRCVVTNEVLACPLHVKIHRSWTPNQGGIPPFEVKPFSDKLEYAFTVSYAIVGGNEEQLHVAPTKSIVSHGEGHDDLAMDTFATVRGRGESRDPHATSALTGFGFELFRPADATLAKTLHLGRYIGGLRFILADQDYNPSTGELTALASSQVWVPDTVVNSGVRTQMDVVSLQLGGESVVVAPEREVQGSLCIHSSEQAPFLTRWLKCGSADKGVEQSESVVNVPLP